MYEYRLYELHRMIAVVCKCILKHTHCDLFTLYTTYLHIAIVLCYILYIYLNILCSSPFIRFWNVLYWKRITTSIGGERYLVQICNSIRMLRIICTDDIFIHTEISESNIYEFYLATYFLRPNAKTVDSLNKYRYKMYIYSSFLSWCIYVRVHLFVFCSSINAIKYIKLHQF